MSLTLAISDKADGTGATATIAGSGGASVTIQVQRPGDIAWTVAGTITGDGTVSLPLASGYFWGVALAAGVVSNLVYFPATTNTDAVAYRCLTGAQAGIQTLSTAGTIGVKASHVYVKMVLDDKNMHLPAIALTPTDTEQILTTGTNAKDDISHPVVCQIVDRNSKDYVAKLPTYLRWRERIIRFFIHQRLSGVPECYTCDIVPEVIFDQQLRDFQYMVSGFVLRFRCREVRGV